MREPSTPLSLSNFASLLIAQMTPRELLACTEGPPSTSGSGALQNRPLGPMDESNLMRANYGNEFPTTPVYPKRFAHSPDGKSLDAYATTPAGVVEAAEATSPDSTGGRPKRWSTRPMAAAVTPTPVKPERVGEGSRGATPAAAAAAAAARAPSWPFAMW